MTIQQSVAVAWRATSSMVTCGSGPRAPRTTTALVGALGSSAVDARSRMRPVRVVRIGSSGARQDRRSAGQMARNRALALQPLIPRENLARDLLQPQRVRPGLRRLGPRPGDERRPFVPADPDPALE